MSLFQAMSASASALTAERLRLEVVSENLANIHTTRTAEGGPYRRRVVTMAPRGRSGFAAALQQYLGGRRSGMPAATGVQVDGIYEDPRPFQQVYDPGHPDADENGFVLLPNVDLAEEMVNLLSATRAYEANVTAFNAARHMALRALEIGRR
ncbi:MAG TPA: flagellar basal body rod protein FlgC [Sphingobacteriaceae bacterium]|nr:flagellar basal body rod protein FlgC [Sphingobacteriaceae bacterium]